MKKTKFEVFRGKNKQWYFRLKARNGKIICVGEGYKLKRSALNGIRSIQKCASSSEVVFVE